MLSSSSDSEEVPGADDNVAPDVKQESDDEREIPAGALTGVRVKQEEDKPKAETSEPWVPSRVTHALKGAGSFKEFRERRVFNFVHLFAGAKDVLGEAIKRMAELQGIKVKVYSLDREQGIDLAAQQPFGDMLDLARTGEVDASHSGFPCGSFSRARYREGSGPPPVRSSQWIYGLPTNTVGQQREADLGSLLAIRSVQLTSDVIQSQRLRKTPDCATLENPPGSEDQREEPAWMLPEVDSFMKQFGCEAADYNTCGFQTKERTRWWKPGRIGGKLPGMKLLARKCNCPKYLRHEALIGKEKTSRAAQYPQELCLEYAKLVVKVFNTVLELEWWRHQQATKKDNLNEVKQKWADSKDRKIVSKPVDDEVMKEIRGCKRAWDAEDIDKDLFPEPAKPSKKARREEENRAFFGGMRNPKLALRKLTVIREAGMDIYRLWCNFVKDVPEALEVARTYGSDRRTLSEEVLREWSTRLGGLLRVENEPKVSLKGKFHFESPLQPQFWEAWQKFSKDPEEFIAKWAREGVPLGMNARIPSSNGIFPPVDDQLMEAYVPELEDQVNISNYSSMHDNEDAAAGEIERLVDRGFAVLLPKQEAVEKFQSGTVSKMALISKMKETGMKHRVIIDLRRSGGNSRCVVPERIILPRIQDVVKGIQDLWRSRGAMGQAEDFHMELIGADVSDAYCHFGVHSSEQANCLAPHIDGERVILFRAMLFGFRGAPLIMGRLSSSMGRMWQSLLPGHLGAVQIYMDDPLVALQGPKKERDSLLSMLLYTSRTFGLNLSYAKGERGTKLTWIGVSLEIDLDNQKIVVDIPKKLVEDLLDKLSGWKGMISVKELRSTTGKLSWAAGIIPRLRWSVSIMYGVVADCDREMRAGLEEARAVLRQGDQRPKTGMVAVKRLELARRWLVQVLSMEEMWRARHIPLAPKPPQWAITSDASPFDIGAVLSAVDFATGKLTPVIALEMRVSRNVADTLGVAFREASGQSALEAWAILIAVRFWKAKIRGDKILVKSDSVVALAITKKLSSGSPTLNWVGAELGIELEILRISEVLARSAEQSG
eukprot:s818_g9.t1